MDATSSSGSSSATALAFDFTNGFHDTANAVATSISTRAMPPRVAVALAAIAELRRRVPLARGRRDDRQRASSTPTSITPPIVFAGLIGAIAWNLATWYFGLPSSLLARADRRRGRRRRSSPRARAPCIGDGLVDKVDRPGARRAGARVRRRPASAILVAYRIVGRQRPGPGHARLPARADRLRAACSRSRTAPTTRRRRWASSPSRWSPNGNLSAGRRRPDLGRRLGGHRDRARHLRRRLADHPHDGQPDHQDGPGAGLRRPGRGRRGDPRRPRTSASRSRRRT